MAGSEPQRPSGDETVSDARQRRHTDRPLGVRLRALVRENWYRDVWLLVITVLVALALSSATDTADHAKRTAQVAAQAAREAEAATRAIQAQRVATVRANCEAQNARHDGTVKQLGKLFTRRRAPGAAVRVPGVPPALVRAVQAVQAIQARASRAPTILLIDALQPHQDCAAAVARATSGPPAVLTLPPILPPTVGQSRQHR